MSDAFYCLRRTAFGTLGIVWAGDRGGARALRIVLPRNGAATERLVLGWYPDSRRLACAAIEALGRQAEKLLEGECVELDLAMLRLDRCTPFQRAVLLADRGIPRGWVSTYGRVAAKVGVPGSARAVGAALAANPFPLAIPCHRVVRSGGSLGGFQAGVWMKRRLLELEGVGFTRAGAVVMRQVWY